MGIAAAATVAGSAYSYSEAQGAVGDAKNAAAQASTSQNTAFNARMAAQRQQTAEQARVNSASADAFSRNQSAQQQAQLAALGQRQQALNTMNTQQQATANQANTVVQQGVNAASAPAMADAQAAQAAQQQALNAPVVQNLQASNPLGAANTGSTKAAMDTAMKGAADYVKNYGDKQAALAAFNAPITLANQQAVGIGTNLMPAGVMDQLVRTGAPALLNPSSTAYQNAGAYGNAANTANQILTAGATGLVNTKAGNAIDLASLQQADDAANIQSNLNVQQQQAAANAALGQGIAAIGGTALMYGAGNGGLSWLTKKPPAGTVGGGYAL
jgi:hypothetical protein